MSDDGRIEVAYRVFPKAFNAVDTATFGEAVRAGVEAVIAFCDSETALSEGDR